MPIRKNAVLAVLLIGGLLVAGLLESGGIRSGLAQSDPPVELPGSLPPDQGRPAVVPNGLSQHDPVTVVLSPRAGANLDKLARQVQDPASPLYRHFLTADQYRQQIAPDRTTFESLKTYFEGQGLSVVYEGPDNSLMTLNGSTTGFDRAFGTHSEYRQSSRGDQGFVNTTALRLPASLAGAVGGVAGFDSLHPAHPHLPDPTSRTISPSAVVTNTPASLRRAYNIDATGQTGAGSRVGILLWRPPDQSALANWQSYYGHNLNLNVIGNTTVLTDTVGLEANMDVEMVHLAAYDAGINFYSAYSAQDGDLTRALGQAVNDDLVSLSGSFGACERDKPAITINSYHVLFQKAAVKGIGLFFSSGDSGVYDCNGGGGTTGYVGFSSYPAGDDLVTSVGGTSLNRDSQTGAWVGETAWSCPTDAASAYRCLQQNGGSSEGGKTVNVARPGYQSTITPPNEPTFTNNAANTRLQPDLSMNADPASGVLVFFVGLDGTNNDYYSGGTSASSPLMAGIMALAAQSAGGKIGGINLFIYTNHTGAAWLSDVTSGYTGVTAKPGWDYTTGLGSLKDVKAFIAALGTTAARPYLRFNALSVSDAGAGNNHNNLIEPGETGQLQISLKNYGSAQASSVSASLSLLGSDPNVSLLTTNVNYGAIGVGATATGPAFTLQVSRNEACNTVLRLHLFVSYGTGYSYSYDFSLPLGATSLGSPVNYAYTGGPQPIPDAPANGLTTSLNLPTTARVGGLKVHLNITHPYDADLVISLVSPGGTRVKLTDSRGNSGANYTGTVFDDGATYFIGDPAHAQPPFGGSYQPEEALSTLLNEPAGGNWQLVVTDIGAGDVGTLNGWSLDLTPLVLTCAAVPNPVPTLGAIVPTVVQVNNPTFTLGVSGTGFVAASAVSFNGSPRPTTYVSDRQLLITVNPADINAVGSLPITVVNPSPGGGTTTALNLSVQAACPDLTVTLTGTLGCGSLPNALAKAGPGSTIGFALQLNPASPLTIALPGAVSLLGNVGLIAPCTTGGPAIIVQSAAGPALRTGAGNVVSGLWFKSPAGGPTLVSTGGTRLSCLKTTK